MTRYFYRFMLGCFLFVSTILLSKKLHINKEIFKSKGRNNDVDVQYQTRRIPVLAYFYPQFYPFHENDVRFGRGFTEWDNLRECAEMNTNGVPVKHPLSKEKGGLDYYVGPDYAVRFQQANLARAIGLTGFIYYQYWIENRPVMDAVLQSLLRDGQPNVSFLLCWVAEGFGPVSWFRGRTQNLNQTFQQRLDAVEEHAMYLLPYLSHPLYIRIKNQPVLQAYKVGHKEILYFKELLIHLGRLGAKLSDPTARFNRIFSVFASFGMSDIKVAVLMDSFQPFIMTKDEDDDLSFKGDPRVDRPQDVRPSILRSTPQFRGSMSDFDYLRNVTGVDVVFGYGLTGWDTTPRHRKTAALAKADFSPERFYNVTVQRFRQMLCSRPNKPGIPNFYSIFAFSTSGEREQYWNRITCMDTKWGVLSGGRWIWLKRWSFLRSSVFLLRGRGKMQLIFTNLSHPRILERGSCEKIKVCACPTTKKSVKPYCRLCLTYWSVSQRATQIWAPRTRTFRNGNSTALLVSTI
jgi:hypothetical protein